MEGGDKEKLDGFGGVTREVFPPPHDKAVKCH